MTFHMAAVSCSQFPIRLCPLRGESLPGYATRFYLTNGHQIPDVIYDAIRSLYRNIEAGQALSLLQSTFGPSPLLGRSWWIDRPIDTADAGRELPKWQKLTLGRARFCPQCLSASDAHFMAFELPLVEACPVHRCALIAECANCQTPLYWRYLKSGWRCRCGLSIKAMTSAPAASWEVRLAGLIARSSDVRAPASFAELTGGLNRATSSYGVRDVYETLTWAHYLIETVAVPHSSPPYRWPTRCKATPRRRPGMWEVKLLAESGAELYPAIVLLLKAAYRYEKGAFVCDFYETPILEARQFLELLPPEKHVFATALHAGADLFISQYRAIAGVDIGVYFHPRQSLSDRQGRLVKLARWWSDLSALVQSVKPALHDDRDSPMGLSGGSFADAYVFNQLFAASSGRFGKARLIRLAALWRVRAPRCGEVAPTDILTEIYASLMELSGRRVCAGSDLLPSGPGWGIYDCCW